MDNNAAVAPEAAPVPAADAAEQAAIAALEKEYGDEAQGQEPKAESEPAKEAKKDEPAAEKKPQPIPYEELEKRHRQLNGALAEERAQRKALAERAENMRQLFEQMQQRQTQAQPQQPAKPAIPDINEDPIGHFAAKVAELEGKLAEKDKAIGQTREQFEAEQAHRQFWGAVQRSETEFKGRTPDYDEATTHLEQARIRELAIMFPDDSERAYEIAQRAGLRTPADLRLATLNQDRISVAQQAFQLGMNPAELYYKLAQERGYQPKGAAPAQKMITPVQAAKAGAAAAKSLSAGAGSGGKDGPLAIEDLAELYLSDPDRADKEFAKLRSAGLLN